jgi:hypothetical protein
LVLILVRSMASHAIISSNCQDSDRKFLGWIEWKLDFPKNKWLLLIGRALVKHIFGAMNIWEFVSVLYWCGMFELK